MSYVLEGPKWAGNTVTWSFATQTLPQDTATPFTATPIDNGYAYYVNAAIEVWQSVSGLNLVQVADSAASDIRIGFADLPTNGGEIGNTSYYSDGITFAPDVVVRLEDPTALPLTEGVTGLAYAGTYTTMYQVALHEIGHALGMDHNGDAGSIMYPSAGLWNPNLDITDVQGIEALYGTPSGTAASAPVLSTAADGTTSVTLHGDHDQYLIAATSDGSLFIQDMVAGRDGTQTIANATDLQFADLSGRFDPTGIGETIARINQVVFGGVPYTPTLDGFMAQAAAGMSLQAITGEMLGQVNSPNFDRGAVSSNVDCLR